MLFPYTENPPENRFFGPGLLERPEVAYLLLRSATNNCYQCRIERS